ncbi:MAG: hypothetical protein WED07_04355 [Candidatus Freyarchaeum deiterrae]
MSVGIEVFQVKDNGELENVPLDSTSLSGALIVIDHNRKNIWFWKESEELPKLLKIVGARIVNSLKLKYGLNYSTKEATGKKESGTFLTLFENLPRGKTSENLVAERKAEFSLKQPVIVRKAEESFQTSEKKTAETQTSLLDMEGISKISISVNININLENFESFDANKLEDLVKKVRDVLKNV